MQVASKTDYNTEIPIETFCVEAPGGTNGNSPAYKLGEWISNTIDNGGYYIARYEASKNGEKAASKPSTGTPATSTSDTISDGMLWTCITQPDASTAAWNMYKYSESSKYYSDLVNSYAWDTAIVFIENYSEGNSSYADLTSKNTSSPLNTGERSDGTTDKACNIYDMASNTSEWSTEGSTHYYMIDSPIPNYWCPCIYRGGCCYNSSASSRCIGVDASTVAHEISFRALLCLND